jgi:hypothetical protein
MESNHRPPLAEKQNQSHGAETGILLRDRTQPGTLRAGRKRTEDLSGDWEAHKDETRLGSRARGAESNREGEHEPGDENREPKPIEPQERN